MQLWRTLVSLWGAMDIGYAAIFVGSVIALILTVGEVIRNRYHHAKAARAMKEDKGGSERIPLTLHPVIDPDICIGSLTCLKSCPEGDILGIVNGAARLIHADHCIGHGKCAAECPVDAIKLVFGTSERGIDLPMVDEFFESSRPGLHIVGELGGMGLIRNAVTQGVQVAERLAQMTGKASNGQTDVVIVGAGPAGLATALTLRAAGRTFRVLDQGSVGGTIANYPRQKIVMTEPFQIPYYGKLKDKRISKEDLLDVWSHALHKAGVKVDEGVKVLEIDGDDGAFRVQTSKGSIDAKKIVLATGLRGTPRKIGCPGEDGANVTYRLIDTEQYVGCRVLVVGGGDAALEAAIQLAEQGETKVAISYRGENFAKCRQANRDKINQLAQEKRLKALMSSQVEKILPDEVVLTVGGSPMVIPNDYVIVNIGGELPLEFLSKLKVSVEKHFGEEKKKPKKVEPVGDRRGLAREKETRTAMRGEHILYFALGALILAWLTVTGWNYYRLPYAARLQSPLHESLRPAGHWGHGIGIIATAFMMLNFVYPLRKRTRVLSGVGSIRGWLDFHMFVGFMSPLVIAFHAAFQSNNALATATSAALLVVVLTGIVGRFIYGLVPASGGKALEIADVVGRWERLRVRLKPMMDDSDNPALLHRMFDSVSEPAPSGSLVLFLMRWPFIAMMTRLHLFRSRFHFDDRSEYLEFREGYLVLTKLRVQVAFYKSLKNLLRGWRLFHASLAAFLVVAIAAHIAVSIYLGYVWIR